ncbi:phage NrS-1 polymerase family protein [Ideonella dechloratans]|uniref:phage NrS-1 polymerase family protein n=1 Tax=Ideonella dechloratans TaxID=36863 RepID=UPI0035B28B8D
MTNSKDAATTAQAAHPLAPLAAYRQFIVVRRVPLASGKTDKIPLTPTGEAADAHNPANWLSWQEAHERAVAWGEEVYGVGFVLTSADPFWCLDFDNCVQADGSWSQLLLDVAAQLGDGVAWEVSQSGKGAHAWGRGPVPPHAKKNVALSMELYTELRFIMLSRPLSGNMDVECRGIAAVAHRYFPAKVASAQIEEGPARESDDEVLQRMLASKGSTAAIYGGAPTPADLHHRNVPVLLERYPGNGADGLDESSVDAALASHLAFRTGRNAAQMKRLMMRSALVRPKWTDRDDYLDRTIANACRHCTGTIYDKPAAALERMQEVPAAEATSYKPEPKPLDGTNFADRETQLQLFDGCCYVAERDAIRLPNGRFLKRPAFDAFFGGNTFPLGGPKGKVTGSAWEAFTENQEVAFPKVHGLTFRPDLPPGHVVVGPDGSAVNSYRPLGRFVAGDAGPFERHVRALLPVGDDAAIFLSYLAACVQYPGRKFTWAPVLQGVDGNGKSLVIDVMRTALGALYVHSPQAAKLSATFNSWMVGKLLIAVNDMPPRQTDAMLEALKPLLTDGRGMEIEAKGRDRVSVDVCCNFLFTTNHRDGIRKNARDRRYCMLFCAQQSETDLQRDGLTVAYFNELHHWLNQQDGLAIAAHYLAHFDIPEQFDPTRGAQRAPRSSSHDEAIAAGRDEVTVLLADLIESDLPGYRGGWVSLGIFKAAAASLRPVPRPQQIEQALQALGYERCPGLPAVAGQLAGRTHNPVLPDGRKTVLFTRALPTERARLVGMRPAEIAKEYTSAQTSA